MSGGLTVERAPDGSETWAAYCDCGWTGLTYSTPEYAIAHLNEHFGQEHPA